MTCFNPNNLTGATTTPPTFDTTDLYSGQSAYFQNSSQCGERDGTVFDAAWFNNLVLGLNAIVTSGEAANGGPLPCSENILANAIQAMIDNSVDNVVGVNVNNDTVNIMTQQGNVFTFTTQDATNAGMALNGTVLTTTDTEGNTVDVDLNGLSNTAFLLNGTTLTITDSGGTQTVDLSALGVFTDDQVASEVPIVAIQGLPGALNVQQALVALNCTKTYAYGAGPANITGSGMNNFPSYYNGWRVTYSLVFFDCEGMVSIPKIRNGTQTISNGGFSFSNPLSGNHTIVGSYTLICP